MRIRVSDYIANFFVENGIHTIFTVVGGGAMYLNNAFANHPKLSCIYNHHEQASAMATEAYYRMNNEMAGLCVTSGPGAINALNGVAGAYQDSIPMIVISGQCKSSLTVRKNNLKLRSLGPQEFDIISSLDNYTKYAESVMHIEDIRYCLEKAFYIALEGRPGPCWLEIPVDIQGAYVETDSLRHYIPEKRMEFQDENLLKMELLIKKLQEAKRPVIYAGNGIRIAGGRNLLCRVTKKLGIPVVTCWNSIDLMETEDDDYVGRGGTMGDRPGNFAVQNADLLLTIGTRLNTYQVGYQIETWARDAYVIDVDVDEKELNKPTIRVDLPICMDAKEFLLKFDELTNQIGRLKIETWRQICNDWKHKYPVVTNNQRKQKNPLNIYGFIDKMSRMLPDEMVTVVANGSASVVGSAAYYIGKEQRFIMNCSISSMGYELPAAIGACVAHDRQSVICIAGDGSIMMNLQEIQTIVTNKLPIKIIVINNEGYHQIRQTQKNLFDGNYAGIGKESGDLSFPSFEKIAVAFGIPYKGCSDTDEQIQSIEWFLSEDGCCMLEVFCDTNQEFEPKSKTKKLKDGSLYSPPLEDMAPFLSNEELKSNMLIPLWSER